MSDDSTPEETAPVEASPPTRSPEVDAPVGSGPAGGEVSADVPTTANRSPGRGWIWGGAAVVVVIALVVGAYFVGRSSVSEGPTSLAEAAQQTAKGDLPVGDLSRGGLGKALGGSQGDILKGLGKLGGKANGNSPLDNLLNELGKRLQEGLNGTGSSNGSSSTSTQQAFLGVSTTNAPGQSGAQVSAVQAGSPAGDAGLQAGDVITAIDGKSVTSTSSLAAQVTAHVPGDVVTVTYSRNGTTTDVRLRLGNTSTPTTTTLPSI